MESVVDSQLDEPVQLTTELLVCVLKPRPFHIYQIVNFLMEMSGPRIVPINSGP